MEGSAVLVEGNPGEKVGVYIHEADYARVQRTTLHCTLTFGEFPCLAKGADLLNNSKDFLIVWWIALARGLTRARWG
jgi:hypothetical protein